MKKFTKQLKSVLLIMLCVILIVPSMNVSAATQKQQAMAAYKKILSASRIYVVPKNRYIQDVWHMRYDYYGSLPKNVYFSLVYIDGDSVPELVLRAKCHGITLYCIWTYKNGKAYRTSYSNGYGDLRGYFPKTGMTLERTVSDGYSYMDSYYKLSGTTAKQVLNKTTHGSGGGADYQIGYRDCTAREFAAKRKSLTKGLAMKKISYVKNTAANRKAKLK